MNMSNEIKQDLNLDYMKQKEENKLDEDTTQYDDEKIGDFMLDTRNLDIQEINKSKFKKGIDEYSYIAGRMAVLTSMGIESQLALDFIERDLIRGHKIETEETK